MKYSHWLFGRNTKTLVVFALLIVLSNILYGQSNGNDLSQKLEQVSTRDSAYLQPIDISTSNIPLVELLRGIARANSLNLVVSPELDFNVSCNFKQAPIIDVIGFFCREHDLELDMVGRVVKILPKPKEPIFNNPLIAWDEETKVLNCDLKGDSLVVVMRTISKLAKVNILVPIELNTKKVWGHIDNLPVEKALVGIGMINKVDVKKIDDNTFSLSDMTQRETQAGQFKSEGSGRGMYIESINVETGSITAQARQTPLEEIVSQIVNRYGVGYVFSSKIEGNATFTVTDVHFEELLNALFVGTNFAFKKEKDVYVFGNRTNLEIFEVRTIKMQHRTIDKVEPLIPNSLKTGVQVTVAKELNSLILSGYPTALDNLEKFLRGIDQIIPLIYIEVLIVDVNKSKGVSTGIDAGLGEAPVATSGTILSGVDLTLSSSSVNKLIDGFNGFGWVNLGKVTPQFYMSIKALEESGDIKIRSTPKLSTLNGYEAVLTSGETKYYKEEMTNWFGSQIPQSSNSFVWRNVNADLKVTITPIVSGDDQITMDIEVTQSEFTPRDPADAPPGSINRSFKSLIRVRNEEMVLLGGLEKNTSSDVSRGVPLLSRIPVLRWFFSSVDKSEIETKLTIFIKPIVIY